jgi:peptidyl-prolyl cis-trans isomerase D
MEAIAKSAGSTVQATDVIMENPMLTGGTRAKVVGTAFALGANKMSAPIEGIPSICC